MKQLEPGKMVTFLIKDIPPSVNHVWKHAVIGGFLRNYMSKEGKEFKEKLKELGNEYRPVPGRILVSMQLQFPTQRRTDIDNYSKVVLDGFNGILWLDDSQIMCLTIVKSYKKNEPCTMISVELQAD